MNNKDLVKVYAYTKAIFNNFKIPTEELEAQTTALIWLKFLKPYSLDVIYSAIDHHAKTNDFMNIVKVAELCQETMEIQLGTHQTVDTYLHEIEIAVSKSRDYESTYNAYNSLSDFCKSIVPAQYYLGRWHNEGFEFSATRIRQLIADKMRSNSMQKSIETNTKLLNVQLNNNLLGDKK